MAFVRRLLTVVSVAAAASVAFPESSVLAPVTDNLVPISRGPLAPPPLLR